MAGQRHGLEFASSEPLGASRLASELNVSDPLSKEDIDNINIKCDKCFKEFKSQYKKNEFSNIVVSSGTLNNLVTIARARVDGFVPSANSNISVTAKELNDACEEIIYTDKKNRKNILGYDTARAEFIQTAAVIAKKVASLAQNDSPWYSSPYALREGLVLKTGDEYLSEGHNSQQDIAHATVSKIEKKILALETAMIDENKIAKSNIFRHSQNVLELSVKIFNQLNEIHKLQKQELELLKYGARLHDLGETIARSKHDVHGAYILFNTVLPGFSPNEATMLRSIIRCHRSHDPRISDRYVGRLDESDLQKVKWLTAILRIADGMDSGKTNSVQKLKISIKPDVIYFYLQSKSDLELEIYSSRRKRLLLEEMTQRDIVISQSAI
jgi:exopolyphosphatase/guanosine-5'-triphosphate,3'-diphosphate pyrophosphatase